MMSQLEIQREMEYRSVAKGFSKHAAWVDLDLQLRLM